MVEAHFKKLYRGSATQKTIFHEGEVVAFTVDEVKAAVGQMKAGKSVGRDGTCKELFQGLLEVEGGASHLAEVFTQVLVTKSVPQEWNHVLLILLAKVPCPIEAKDLRPIALSSGSSKLFARLLLNRCLPKLGANSPAQCARKHRQCADYVFSLWRVLELCREWHLPIVCVKVDIKKAFDTVHKGKLISKLRARLGDTAEMACWERLILDTRATLLSPWGQSDFDLFSGIKQGAVESPSFFSLLMEEALDETAEAHEWVKLRRLFQDFEHENALFMDDGLLWGPDTGVVAVRLEQFLRTLSQYGLEVNVKKCQLYCSRDVPGAQELQVAGYLLKSVDAIDVMGLRMRKGMTVCELIQPLLARAKTKFWSVKHLLRCKSPLPGRLALFERVVAGAGLWCLAASPPDNAAMGLLNAMQTMLLGWMLRLSKYPDETWLQFKQRSVRASRCVLHRWGFCRWSTLWLRKWWDYSGHRVRAVLSDSPPLSSLLDQFRTLSWWRRQQNSSTGVKRGGRHYAKLTIMEESMNKPCGGYWRDVAHDRGRWKGLRDIWVQQNDLPWTSGRQLALPPFA